MIKSGMPRRILPALLAALAAACAGPENRETPRLGGPDCRVGELGWWDGPVRRCSWYPFPKSAPAEDQDLDKKSED